MCICDATVARGDCCGCCSVGTGTCNGGSFASAFVCVFVRPLLHDVTAADNGLSNRYS